MAERTNESKERSLEKKLKAIENRIEQIGKSIEDGGERKKKETNEPDCCHIRRDRGDRSIFGGVVIILIGFIWLGSNMGWFNFDIPWVPVGMIVLGLYLILKYRRTEGGKESNRDS